MPRSAYAMLEGGGSLTADVLMVVEALLASGMFGGSADIDYSQRLTMLLSPASGGLRGRHGWFTAMKPQPSKLQCRATLIRFAVSLV